jgi:hypothetical protein
MEMENIPERFHILFNTDWNKGNESTMTSTERGQLNELYLEYNKWQLKVALAKTLNLKPDEESKGFPRD